MYVYNLFAKIYDVCTPARGRVLCSELRKMIEEEHVGAMEKVSELDLDRLGPSVGPAVMRILKKMNAPEVLAEERLAVEQEKLALAARKEAIAAMEARVAAQMAAEAAARVAAAAAEKAAQENAMAVFKAREMALQAASKNLPVIELDTPIMKLIERVLAFNDDASLPSLMRLFTKDMTMTIRGLIENSETPKDALETLYLHCPTYQNLCEMSARESAIFHTKLVLDHLNDSNWNWKKGCECSARQQAYYKGDNVWKRTYVKGKTELENIERKTAMHAANLEKLAMLRAVLKTLEEYESYFA